MGRAVPLVPLLPGWKQQALRGGLDRTHTKTCICRAGSLAFKHVFALDLNTTGDDSHVVCADIRSSRSERAPKTHVYPKVQCGFSPFFQQPVVICARKGHGGGALIFSAAEGQEVA